MYYYFGRGGGDFPIPLLFCFAVILVKNAASRI